MSLFGSIKEGLSVWKRDKYILPALILSMIAGFIPLIVRYKKEQLTLEQSIYWSDVLVNYDFFSHYRAIFLIVMTALALAALIASHFAERDWRRFCNFRIVAPVAFAVLYIVFVLISTYKPLNTETALQGFADRHEGVFVLVAYALLFIIASLAFRSEFSVKVLLVSVFACSLIVAVLSILQQMGYDYFFQDWARKLILPEEVRKMKFGISYSEGAKSIYSTFSNSNYLGLFMSLITPIALVVVLKARNWLVKIMMLILTALFMLSGWYSSSRSFLLALAITLPVIIALMWRDIWKRRYLFIPVFVVIIAGLLIIWTSNVSDVQGMAGRFLTPEKFDKSIKVNDIKIGDGIADVYTTEENIRVLHKDKRLLFLTLKNEIIPFTVENNAITFLNSDYAHFRVQLYPEDKDVELFIGLSSITFHITKDLFYVEGNQGKPILQQPVVESFGFTGKEKIMSGRGYIWSRSIPLIKNTILKGFGPDCFVFGFPQDDIVGKMKGLSFADIVVDKPHSIYLQMALNTGIISSLALMAIFAVYTILCVWLYIIRRRKSNSFINYSGRAIFAGVTCYLVAGIANDSVVAISPVFWVILGCGFAVNFLVSKEDRNTESLEASI